MDMQTKTMFQEPMAQCGQTCLKVAAINAYSQQKEPLAGDDLVAQFLPMIHKIVQRAVTYIKPPLSYEDLVSAGMVGLLKAAEHEDYYDSDTDFNPFKLSV